MEDLEQSCCGCSYCEYLETSMVCRHNGKECPTDGTCYKEQIGGINYADRSK